MKHYIRREDLDRLSLSPANSLPDRVVVTHVGSEQEFPLALQWRAGRYAETTFKLPDDAKLGMYRVTLKRGTRSWQTGSFRVEEFRLPVMRGSIDVRAAEGSSTSAAKTKAPRDFVRPQALSAQVAISYTNGGSAAAL